jgi:hypothetical protein
MHSAVVRHLRRPRAAGWPPLHCAPGALQVEDYIEKVEVELHPTFDPPQLALTQPPFNVGRVGVRPGVWGRLALCSTPLPVSRATVAALNLTWQPEPRKPLY